MEAKNPTEFLLCFSVPQTADLMRHTVGKKDTARNFSEKGRRLENGSCLDKPSGHQCRSTVGEWYHQQSQLVHQTLTDETIFSIEKSLQRCKYTLQFRHI